MKNKKAILIVITSILVTGIVAAALFKVFENNNSEGSVTPPIIQEEEVEKGTTITQEADAFAKEGLKLMSTEPLKAQDKFIEAQKAYKKAGDEAKASEMETNILTAKSHHTLDPEYPSSTTDAPKDSSDTAKSSIGPADFVDVK